MKPGNAAMFHAKPFEYNNSAFDTGELEEIMKEHQNGALCNLNNCENDADQLACKINDKNGFCNTPHPKCTMVGEDFTNGDGNEKEVKAVAPSIIPSNEMEPFERDGDLYTDKNGNENEVRNENEFGDSVAQCAMPSCTMELFEDTDLFTDKNIMECELPKLIVSYKENTYHVVKDICIDEKQVFSRDKILIDGENDKGFCTIVPFDGNRNGCMTEGEEIELLSPSGSKSSSENDYDEVDAYECGTTGKVEIELLISDVLKSSSENYFDDNIGNDGESLVPVQIGEANCNITDKIVDDISGEKFVKNSLPSPQKFSKQKFLKSLLESLDCDGNDIERQSAKIPCSKANCDSPAAEESKKSNPINDLPYNSKVESSTITFDFKSSKPSASGRDESSDDDDDGVVVDHEQPRKINRHEDGILDSLAVAGEVVENVHGQGERSFSMAGPVLGLITYSGPIAFSGSVSLRSDSSATSTRSFAFPVLQSEWNSSPVRMAKAERRHYRRHRGRRHGLLFCCRF
ncbi:hypothetical protein HYC85_023454 [Camellia sinensis]|uniref:Uncharacterized protein n=1 Tax=Camellia sinensis TaxID=4442 RepID=A0A7J7GFW3_CAMSI|nr:hypothetical protein HYC85_023454 [Camellia sinensis]